MRMTTLFLCACALAALAPLVPGPPPDLPLDAPFPGWPSTLFGEPLVPEPLQALEAAHARTFPGRLARFRCGERAVLAAFVTAPTRQLHPRELCLRAAGWTVTPQAGWTDGDGGRWGVLLAERNGERRRVIERAVDGAGLGWPDPSAWYWAALLGRTTGPWWYLSVEAAEPR